jgi:hypothetical protein
MRRPPGARTAGVTLPEVLTVVMVISVIVGTVTAIFMMSMQTWYRGAAETYAEQKASLAIQRMVPDLQQGLSVTPAGHPYGDVCIAVEMPAKAYDSGEGVYLNQVATDTEGKPYLVSGDYAVYYRGDENGNLSLTGNRMWRRLVRASDGATLKNSVIADNIVDNPSSKPMFIYWPDVYRLRSVEVTVTVEEKRGSRTATKTMTGELALRNN